MASIAKILPHLEKGERSPDSSDNGFDSFGSGSGSSPERLNEADFSPKIENFQNSGEQSSDSGRVSSPEGDQELLKIRKSNSFRPWENESKGKAESRVPELGLHSSGSFSFGIQNLRLPFMGGIGTGTFPSQFSPFGQNQLGTSPFALQQFLQQSQLAQTYANQQKAYAALRLKSEFELQSLQNSSVFEKERVKSEAASHGGCCGGHAGSHSCGSHSHDTCGGNHDHDHKMAHKSQSKIKKKENGNKPYKCPICEAQFNRPANLKTHLRIHSGEKPYKCDTCGARFVQVAHLRAHVLIHTGEKPYPCQICGTRFRHLQTLKSHIRIHTGEKPFSCDECSLRFRHKSQLRLHLRTKHGINTNTKKSYTFVPGLNSADLSKMIKDNSKVPEDIQINEVAS